MKVLLLFISSEYGKSIYFRSWEKLYNKISLFKYIRENEIDGPWAVFKSRVLNYAIEKGFIERCEHKQMQRDVITTVSFSITDKGEREVEKLLKSLK